MSVALQGPAFAGKGGHLFSGGMNMLFPVKGLPPSVHTEVSPHARGHAHVHGHTRPGV